MRRQSADTPRRIVAALLLLILLGALFWLVTQIGHTLQARGMQSGFDFLWQPAGFSLSESWLVLPSNASYWQALLAGLLNSLRVALPALLLATLLGTAIGAARRSINGLARGLALVYVETLRNIPLLLQLLAWYFCLTSLLPDNLHAWSPLPHFYLSKAGLAMPALIWHQGSLSVDYPQPAGFAIEGGTQFSPEFMSLLLALSLYTAAYIAEVVRSGLQAIATDQSEAATLLGASAWQRFWRVEWPQALRVILPPLGNQYLNLIKNSSLAVAIGYPDLMAVSNTTLNQTGRAFECLSIILVVYSLLSLLLVGLIGYFNRKANQT